MRTPLSKMMMMITAMLAFAGGLQAQSRFLYTNDDVLSANTISGFSVDSNGNLTPLSGSPFSTGGGGTDGGAPSVSRIVVAGGQFLYASNGGTNNISAFSVDPNTGALAAVAGSPFSITSSAGIGDISLAASPNGQFLFAGVASNTSLVTFGIAANGSLTELSSVPLPDGAAGMKVTADGKYLAVSLPIFGMYGGVAMFSIDSAGALTLLNGGPVSGATSVGPVPDVVSDVDIDCAGSNVFAAAKTSGAATVDVFSIGSGGMLTLAAGSPFSAAQGWNSFVGILSPNDQFLFVSNQGDGLITVFSVNSGALSPVTGSPFSASGGGLPAGMATDQSGKILYVAAGPNFIHTYSIAANGSLTSASGSPFTTNQANGDLLSLAAFPAKTCSAGPVGGPPPPGDPKPIQIQLRSDDGDDDDPGALTINPKSHQYLRVAVLSSPALNAPAQVSPSSLTFGHSGTEKSLVYCDTRSHDVNHDGLSDLVCHFEMDKMNFQSGDTEGLLQGMLLDGTTQINGKAPVKIAH
jgi:6-phosphogluconolactonase (cycloisomerase 2 family)